jgi:phosphohistidine phosphatase
MKTLYLIRHAKSSWDDPQLSDHDRPLNKRGERDAPLMAKILKKKKIKPDLILSSSAVRALEYAKVISSHLDYKKKDIVSTKDLYLSDEDEMLKILKNVKDSNDIVFLFGHNPDITSFANSLCSANLDNIPTSGICEIEFDTDNWNDIDYGKGKFKSFDYPKKYL